MFTVVYGLPKKLYVKGITTSLALPSSTLHALHKTVGETAVDGAKVIVEYVNPELAKLEANVAVPPAQTAVGLEVGVNATPSITPTVAVSETAPQPVTVAFMVYTVVTVGLAMVEAPEVVDKLVFGDQVIDEPPVNCVLKVTEPPAVQIRPLEGFSATIDRTVTLTEPRVALEQLPLLSSAYTVNVEPAVHCTEEVYEDPVPRTLPLVAASYHVMLVPVAEKEAVPPTFICAAVAETVGAAGAVPATVTATASDAEQPF